MTKKKRKGLTLCIFNTELKKRYYVKSLCSPILRDIQNGFAWFFYVLDLLCLLKGEFVFCFIVTGHFEQSADSYRSVGLQ